MGNENMVKMVDSDGVVLHEFNAETHYLRSKKQDTYYKENIKAKEEFNSFNSDAGKFIWSYPTKIQELINSKDFSKADISMIFYLATYVNGLGYLAHDNNNVKLQKSDIQTVLGVSRNPFNRFYNKLIRYEILIPSIEGKLTDYKWSSEYNFYGKTAGIAKPTELIRTYVQQIRYLYEATKENGRKRYSATALYPIFALVPYLHHSTNIVCKNPDVLDIKEIEYYSLSEIATLLDAKDSKHMSQSLSSILLDGQTTFRSVESRNERYLQLNPSIFWRDVVTPPKNLVDEFKMMDNNRELHRVRRVKKNV